jgi:osmotically-inducible protein OsmY
VITRLLGVLILSALGGLNQPISAAANAAVSVSRPVSQTRTLPDAQIERNMRAKLAKSKLNADHYTFSVQNGVVTIEGKTNVMQHKGVMTRMAKTSGAVAVRNNIKISDEAKASALSHLAKNGASGAIPRATITAPNNVR